MRDARIPAASATAPNRRPRSQSVRYAANVAVRSRSSPIVTFSRPSSIVVKGNHEPMRPTAAAKHAHPITTTQRTGRPRRPVEIPPATTTAAVAITQGVPQITTPSMLPGWNSAKVASTDIPELVG